MKVQKWRAPATDDRLLVLFQSRDRVHSVSVRGSLVPKPFAYLVIEKNCGKKLERVWTICGLAELEGLTQVLHLFLVPLDRSQ
jgi:hypothetical protein